MNMIGDFMESFGKEKDERRELPREVVEALNDNLPDNFEYKMDRSGKYRAVPKVNKALGWKMDIVTQFDFDQVPKLLNKLKTIPENKWGEYLYRTQTPLPIKSAKIGDESKRVPLEMLSTDAFHFDEVRITDCMMKPDPFPETRMTFESPEGDVVQMGFRQQAYDSVTEIKFANIDFSALKIELYRYSPLAVGDEDGAHTSSERQLTVKYSVEPAKASTVKDAVAALHIFRGLFNGKTKVDGKMISADNVQTQIDSDRIDDALMLWETILKIENKLEVTFDPGAELPNEDVRFLTELRTCLLEGKAILWRHPFDHFHVGGFRSVKDGVSLEDCIGNESIRYEFLEGPIPATLLGCKFDLYSRTEMKDFIITNIEWDDESRENAEIYISDGRDKQWILTRLYMTKKQADEYKRQPERKNQ